MDDVECESPSTTFSSCASNSDHNCDHRENVLLTCFASGNVFIRSASWSTFGETKYLAKGTDSVFLIQTTQVACLFNHKMMFQTRFLLQLQQQLSILACVKSLNLMKRFLSLTCG